MRSITPHTTAPLVETAPPPSVEAQPQTVWGLDAVQLHDRFWAARGVQVIRLGQPTELVDDAELFLLTDPHSLSIFRLGQLVDTLSWLKPQVLFVRLHNTRVQGYTERVITDENDRFVRFERTYSAPDWRLGRVALTPSRELAQYWQRLTDGRTAWRQLRRSIVPNQRTTLSVVGCVYDNSKPAQVLEFVRELVTVWRRPDATIQRAKRFDEQVWSDATARHNPQTRFVGPVWVGAGRSIEQSHSVVGPAVLWDAPHARPAVEKLQWNQIEPSDVLIGPIKLRTLSSVQRGLKRALDIVGALIAITLTMPLYPFIMLAIMLDDGRPCFFGHRRESMHGREFSCLKFRTMRKDAEQIKANLAQANQADGPQFFMKDDPRISRVGKFLRKTNLDELPQFFNVLAGHMAMVGPRPSPYKENQFCPPWREARLSVRPGVTGLWQVERSRDEGRDFQEWIRYDIYYVEHMNWLLDLKIIVKTVLMILGLRRR